MELSDPRDYRDWSHLCSVVMLEANRQVGMQTTVERRYYISGPMPSAAHAAEIPIASKGKKDFCSKRGINTVLR